MCVNKLQNKTFWQHWPHFVILFTQLAKRTDNMRRKRVKDPVQSSEKSPKLKAGKPNENFGFFYALELSKTLKGCHSYFFSRQCTKFTLLFNHLYLKGSAFSWLKYALQIVNCKPVSS